MGMSSTKRARSVDSGRTKRLQSGVSEPAAERRAGERPQGRPAPPQEVPPQKPSMPNGGEREEGQALDGGHRGRPRRDSPDRESWKKLLATLLKQADNPPRSKDLADTVKKYLGKRRDNRTVSSALIDKWRSVGPSNPQAPTDSVMANALLDALEERLVIRPRKPGNQPDKLYDGLVDELPGQEWDPESIRCRLIQWLFKDAVRDSDPEAKLYRFSYLAAHELFEELWQYVSPDATWDDSDTAFVGACLMSNRKQSEDVWQLIETSSGTFQVREESDCSIVHVRHIVMFLYWDGRDREEAQEACKKLKDEIQAKKSMEFITDRANEGLATHVVLGVYRGNDRENGQECMRELQDIARGLFEACNSNGRKHCFVWRKDLENEAAAPYPMSDFWLLLFPDGDSKLWRSMRHPEQFKRIRYSRATRLCAPIGGYEKQAVCSWMGIKGSKSVATGDYLWRVLPGARISMDRSSGTEHADARQAITSTRSSASVGRPSKAKGRGKHV